MIAPPAQDITTLGRAVFECPLFGSLTVSEMRQQLEIKYCACLALKGTGGFPIDVRRIQNPHLRALAGAGMTLKNWTVQDLTRITGDLAPVAETVLLATLEEPEWGAHDLIVMGIIESLESMRSLSSTGGKTL